MALRKKKEWRFWMGDLIVKLMDSVKLNLDEFEKTLKYNNKYEFYYRVEML